MLISVILCHILLWGSGKFPVWETRGPIWEVVPVSDCVGWHIIPDGHIPWTRRAFSVVGLLEQRDCLKGIYTERSSLGDILWWCTQCGVYCVLNCKDVVIVLGSESWNWRCYQSITLSQFLYPILPVRKSHMDLILVWINSLNIHVCLTHKI